VFVVDDFLAHIDRRAIEIERDLYHVDSPHYTRAEASRLEQEYLLSGPVAGRKRSKGIGG
jgi:hypothetical protein